MKQIISNLYDNYSENHIMYIFVWYWDVFLLFWISSTKKHGSIPQNIREIISISLKLQTASKIYLLYTVLTGVKAALAYKPHPDFEPKKKKKKLRRKKKKEKRIKLN